MWIGIEKDSLTCLSRSRPERPLPFSGPDRCPCETASGLALERRPSGLSQGG